MKQTLTLAFILIASLAYADEFFTAEVERENCFFYEGSVRRYRELMDNPKRYAHWPFVG